MAHINVYEYYAKQMLSRALPKYSDGKRNFPYLGVLLHPPVSYEALEGELSWLAKERLVVKPDQAIGKRRKHNLILLNVGFAEAQFWIEEKSAKDVAIENVTGKLTHFLIEQFIPHTKEYYVAIKNSRDCDKIYFSCRGGVDIEENWDTVTEISVGILDDVNGQAIALKLTQNEDRELIADFIAALFHFYRDYNFTFLEINPFTIGDGQIIPLDMVAQLDSTASFESGKLWGEMDFPIPFGRTLLPEEEYIKKLDAQTGASLKLTVLNPKGRIWTLVAGGGASVIYADTISDLGYGKELANYGEYSGDPSAAETYEYAKTVFDLMTRDGASGKVLIIGGGIANFTDVAKTFVGIIKALEEFQEPIKAQGIRVYVRRGGPNYQEGLRAMQAVGEKCGIPMEVFGPETHMTEIVKMAVDEM